MTYKLYDRRDLGRRKTNRFFLCQAMDKMVNESVALILVPRLFARLRYTISEHFVAIIHIHILAGNYKDNPKSFIYLTSSIFLFYCGKI